ncbi:MAG: ArsR family transcriptional regulator [Bacteroidia bacterium]|nr:ArsR family transcriptional regulator [Bacteroidia bacterium]
MIETLISSKTRIKLLLKFFLNSNTTAYLRNLEAEFGESSNAIRVELNRFEQAGMLQSKQEGNKKIFQVNARHPLFQEIHSIVRKYIGLDQILENVIKQLGNVERVYLTGDFSRGQDAEVIDLIIVGEVNRSYLAVLTEKAEKIIQRKIRYLNYAGAEFTQREIDRMTPPPLLLWSWDN